MGYFDALASSSFKQVEGRWLFYPWGALGRGYAIPTESRYLELRSWVKRSLQIWLPLVILTGVLAGWMWAFVLLPVFGAWYFIRIQTITKGLEATTDRITVADSYRAQAQGHSLVMLWFLEICSVAFVIAGIFILTLDSDEWLIAVTSIGFFGACAAAIGFMIASRGKKSNS